MAPLWNSAEAAMATGGRVTRDFVATGVSIDTRSLAPGDLFAALTDQRDGHDFVADALAKGAAAALVSRIPEGCRPDAPLLVVPDVLDALGALGRAGRARTRAKVVAVTGSVGKTSTKEMLRAVLAGQGRTHAAEASFNNHWGVPLTLARMPKDCDFAVIEIGMNHAGEIAPLTRLARPHLAMITTVAAVHLEFFPSLAAIAEEKASIFEGLEPDGIAVIPTGIDVTPILDRAAAARAGRIIRFGAGADDDYRLIDAALSDENTVIRAVAPDGDRLFKLNTVGRHFALNALAVLAAAEALGADPAIAMADLGRWRPPAGRGKRERVYLDIVEDHLSFDLIDDAFNAGPASMAAALEVLAATKPRDTRGRRPGRRIAVLGDMLELGSDELALHRAIADHPALAAVDVIHCVGPRMRALWDVLPRRQRGEWQEVAPAMAARAHQIAHAGDIVLVKGSKGSKVSLVVDALKKLGQPGAGEARGDD
ncbi:MAG: UDP-N-acetylmuramoyl-tripeptide--D-alanyl-D-alanine ligase [Rhodobacteraceae bacterium]|nr:UDP-N-acetylmuramoyl-tripeptide--D-alanyl-D-alanine ligase [Paracoccaceae bacterium]